MFCKAKLKMAKLYKFVRQPLMTMCDLNGLQVVSHHECNTSFEYRLGNKQYWI